MRSWWPNPVIHAALCSSPQPLPPRNAGTWGGVWGPVSHPSDLTVLEREGLQHTNQGSVHENLLERGRWAWFNPQLPFLQGLRDGACTWQEREMAGVGPQESCGRGGCGCLWRTDGSHASLPTDTGFGGGEGPLDPVQSLPWCQGPLQDGHQVRESPAHVGKTLGEGIML